MNITVILNKIFLGINWKGYNYSLIGNVWLEGMIGTNVQQGQQLHHPGEKIQENFTWTRDTIICWGHEETMV